MIVLDDRGEEGIWGYQETGLIMHVTVGDRERTVVVIPTNTWTLLWQN